MLTNYALLPTLLELAGGRTFAEAAGRLRLTPSAVSHQMRTLEAQLGFRLFERAGRRAKLTPGALSLIGVVGEHLPPINDALEALLDDGQAVRGTVRVGGALPFSRMWLRPRLPQLLKQYPELRLELSFGPPSQLIPKLQSGSLDLAIIAAPVDSPLLESSVIGVEEFWAVCAKGYAGRELALERQRFIVYDDSRPMHDAWWRSVFGRRIPKTENVACTVANLDEMLYLVEAGLGVAVLPNYLVKAGVTRGKLLRLAPRKASPQNPVHLLWRKSAIQTSRLQTVRSALLG